jgi:NodT family efflux transporter outer membrane factor (OMF) lipoprotein
MSRKRSFLSRTAAVCLLLIGIGCAPDLGPNAPREADNELPGEWSAQTAEIVADDAAISPVVQEQWNRFFEEPDLRSLIAEALENNQELNVRVQEMIIAENEVSARRGEYLPRVDVGMTAGREKVGHYTSQGINDEENGVPENLLNLEFGLTASWEVDVWGKLRNAAKAARARYLSSVEAKNFLVTEIVAEIANSYYELLALDNQIEVLKRNIELQNEALEVVKLKKKAARATELAVERFQAEVLKNRSRRYDLEQQRIEVENRINLLVGRFPTHVERDSMKFKDAEPRRVATGLPSALLDNRPDVRAAAMQLKAAKLDVEVAKARFYPVLSVEAEVGYESFKERHLVDTPESLLYNVAGNLVAPLLNRAAIKAEYRSANAKQIQAVFEFEQTLLRSFTEVVNYVAMSENLQKRYDRLTEQVDKLEEATEVSNVLYRSARADYMEVLLTRRDALDAEMELIETKKLQMNAMIGIYRALGGGWREG